MYEPCQTSHYMLDVSLSTMWHGCPHALWCNNRCRADRLECLPRKHRRAVRSRNERAQGRLRGSLSLSSTRERRLCSSLSYAARARDRAGRALTFLNKQVFFISRELCSSLCELYAARGGPASFFDFSRTGRALQSELCAPPPSSRARGHIYILSRALQSVSYARPRVRAAAF